MVGPGGPRGQGSLFKVWIRENVQNLLSVESCKGWSVVFRGIAAILVHSLIHSHSFSPDQRYDERLRLKKAVSKIWS